MYMSELSKEYEELEVWMRQHDYVGVKIATGRATIEEYADVIAEMKEKANRINEIRKEMQMQELQVSAFLELLFQEFCYSEILSV